MAFCRSRDDILPVLLWAANTADTKTTIIITLVAVDILYPFNNTFYTLIYDLQFDFKWSVLTPTFDHLWNQLNHAIFRSFRPIGIIQSPAFLPNTILNSLIFHDLDLAAQHEADELVRIAEVHRCFGIGP